MDEHRSLSIDDGPVTNNKLEATLFSFLRFAHVGDGTIAPASDASASAS